MPNAEYSCRIDVMIRKDKLLFIGSGRKVAQPDENQQFMSKKIKTKSHLFEGFSSTTGIRDLYYPLDTVSAFKVAGSLLECLPSATLFKDANFFSIKEFLLRSGFIELSKYNTFERETKDYGPPSCFFYNEPQKMVIFISCDSEENIEFSQEPMTGEDYINSIISEPDIDIDMMINGKLCYTHVFYSLKETDLDWRTKFFQNLETITLTDRKIKVKKNSINFLCYDSYYRLKNLKVKRKIQGDLQLNYSNDFAKIHDHLFKFLESDDTGLAIMYGEMGTGKTMYLRYLLSILNKKVIYIPPNLVNRVADPDFLSFMLTQNDFILVIEDAESVVKNRETTGNTSGVSNLLNLSDGILGECIKVKIIVTFNCKIDDIDSALMRKGRLRLQHEFTKLNVEDSNRLLKHLKFNHVTKEPMSLADIYGLEEENFKKEKVKTAIGFNAKT